jgi:DNA-binding transcriptional LysR family regulator
VDLRLLRSFRAVVDAGTVNAAASYLHISQPALSRQLQQLERQVSVRLFERERGRLMLTAAGRAFLSAADDVLAAAENARSLADALAAGRLERIRMAAPTTTLTDVIAPFLATLDVSDPLITVREATYSQALSALRSERDLAVITAPPPRQFASVTVASLPVWAYVSPSHRLAAETSITLTDLAREPLVLLHDHFRARTLVDERLASAGLSPLDVIECDHPQVAQALAASGRGVAVLSDDPRFDLVPLRILIDGGADLQLTLHAAWNRQHHAATQLASVAERLALFCQQRYKTI